MRQQGASAPEGKQSLYGGGGDPESDAGAAGTRSSEPWEGPAGREHTLFDLIHIRVRMCLFV